MASVTTDRLQAIGYTRARQLLVLAGLAILGVITVIMYVRRVDSVEVIATLLFVPVFLGFLFFKAPGGAIAAVGASIVYVVLRVPAIEAVGFGEFAALIMSRCFAYLVFGLLGGWANQVLESSLDKLDLYDQIDDDTGLFNARYFVQDTELEVARSKRYKTLFSIGLVEAPAAPIADLGRRRQASALKELGTKLAESVRTVDRVSHARDGSRHLFAAVLPETGAEGAEIFTSRFADAIHAFLADRGVSLTRGDVNHETLTVPGDDDELGALRRRFAEIDTHEHEHATPA